MRRRHPDPEGIPGREVAGIAQRAAAQHARDALGHRVRARDAEPTPAPTPTASPAVSLHQMIAGLMVVGFRGSKLSDAPWVEKALATGGLGGVILFDRDQLTGAPRNVRSPAQVERLTSQLAAAAGRGIIVSVDQEGGVVTRLGPAHGFPAVASQATIGKGTKAEARSWARGLAATLATSGFTLNFAPVVDLDVNPTSPAIGALDRSFSADPAVVVEMASIEIRAHHQAGVRTTLEALPGDRQLEHEHGLRRGRRDQDLEADRAGAVPAADRRRARGRRHGRSRRQQAPRTRTIPPRCRPRS